MLGKYPLFNGTSTLEQVQQVMTVLGSPEEEDLKEFPQAAAWISANPKRGISFQSLYPQYDDHTICLLDYLLQFNPYKRPTADLALKHIFFQALRQNPMVIAFHEFNCLSQFDSSYEDIISDEDIKLLILREAGKCKHWGMSKYYNKEGTDEEGINEDSEEDVGKDYEEGLDDTGSQEVKREKEE